MPRILCHIIDARHLATPNHKHAPAQQGGTADFASLLAKPVPLQPETQSEVHDREAVDREDDSSRDGDQPPPQEQSANPALAPAWNPMNLSTALPPVMMCSVAAGSVTQGNGQSPAPSPTSEPEVRPDTDAEKQETRQAANHLAPQTVKAHGTSTLKPDNRHADEDSRPAAAGDHDKQCLLPAVAQDQHDEPAAKAIPDARAGEPIAVSDTAASPVTPTSQKAVPLAPAATPTVHAPNVPETPVTPAPARQILALLDAPGAALPMVANPLLNPSGATGEIRVLRMKLRPEALGDVDITLRRRGADMRIDITVTTQAAADALQTDLGLLKERVGSLLRPEGAQSVVVVVQSADNLPTLQGGASGDAGSAMGGSFAEGGGERSPSRKRETPSPAREGEGHEETRVQPVSVDLIV
ncbi:MAG: flagellar hook-length control protein FliK [Aestuariivirga sp.]|uniref:flagellar hook-length control protein FliK n=1 Tax=Aestuariivirga sp. TaxID=2650926 RepID=UPI0025B96A5A|nr:flagellar hook-length control protein FliK [Aestuariivirga sp.]MCA3561400.1 flagellar hook-length control protein FliK [Aestuariivirga sp.]